MNTKFASSILALALAATACMLPSQFALVPQVPDVSLTPTQPAPTLTQTTEPTLTPTHTATAVPPTETATQRPPTNTPTPIIPMARVTYNGLVNIRSGACNQSIIMAGSPGMEFPVTGRYTTATGEVWWRIQIPAENGGLREGWIWGDLVEVSHETLVSTVPSECPPFATATPSIVIKFAVAPHTIRAGECAMLAWRVEGVKEIFLWDGFQYYQVTRLEAHTVCPAYTTDYSLEITLPNDDVLIRTVTLNVTP